MFTRDKRIPTLTDTDLMPFGKHKGEPLQDVPAFYLAWLWREGLDKESAAFDPTHTPSAQDRIARRSLANYIWNAKSAIEQETGETL